MTSPFKLIDLPDSTWAVSWSEQLTSDKFRLMPGGEQVLNIMFKEMRLCKANLGVLLRGGELETLTIDAETYYQQRTRTADFVSLYIVAGAVFDTESLARRFQTIAEQQYLVSVLRS